jgi:hypothetical protein
MNTNQSVPFPAVSKALIAISAVIFIIIVSGLVYVCTKDDKQPLEDITNAGHIADLSIKIDGKLEKDLHSHSKKNEK